MSDRLSDATSHDALTREQAAVHGEQPDSYRYPFSKEATDYSRNINLPWADSLPEEDRGPDGLYRQEGFDLQEAASKIDGPIVEVGGPTLGGYNLLRGVDLPSKPNMFNIRGSRVEAIGAASLTAVDKLALSALADVRALPLANDSLGMMMAANLPGAREEVLREIGTHPDLSNDEKVLRTFDVADNTYKDAADKLEAGDDKGLEAHDAPRIAAIAQARRVLKPGGLFVAQGLESRDVAFAKALGLELVMHTPRAQGEYLGRTYDMIEEVVFKKPTHQ